jgi:hypothetical protein
MACRQSRVRFQAAIGRSDDPAFPLQYETASLGADDAPIAGTFTAVTDAD